jgi:predicted amidohydrolase YtcJ
MPGETVGREAALASYTAQGAYAAFAESRFGEIKPGMRADFVVVDRDPLLVAPQELRATRVLQTWVGGERVYLADQEFSGAGG